MNRASVGLVVGVLIAAGGCGSTKSCKQGTLLVTVTFDGTTSAADDVEVEVTTAGGSPKQTTLAHKSGMTDGSIEIDFPSGYPAGERVDVTVVAQKAGATLGMATATVQALAAGCRALALTVSAADGGAGGNGAAGQLGSGGSAAGGSGGSGGAARGGAGGGAGTGGNGTGGIAGTGGTGTGGSAAGGSGGAARGGSGGGAGTGGNGTGGIAGTGGTGTGGTTGTGGVTGACQGTETQCSANGLQTCMNGQWGAAVACGTRQTCTGPVGAAKCTCNIDPVCKAVGSACDTAAKLAACSQDANGCFFELTSSPCANGACSGAAGLAACCTNACTTLGRTCGSTTSLQTCTLAASGCTVLSTSSCTNGACSGAAGSAACCTNACTVGTTCGSSTSLQTCSVAANGCTASSAATCSTGLLCERIAPASCADPNWAEWPMPNCPSDVAAGAPNNEAYTDNGDGTVTDTVTGLMWQKVVATGTFTWAQAVAFCPMLTLATHSDWRLPTIIELTSLVDLGQANPSINGTAFPATPASAFWSSSPLAGSSASAWNVDFSDGNAGTNDVSNTADVRCVR